MNYYKAIIQYDGTNYYGFQWQKDIPTIQNDFNQALLQLIRGKVTTMGASRTDSGVHAAFQVVKITTEQELHCKDFLSKLGQVLPPQIRCLSLEVCEGSFKPSVDSTSKEYRYFFTNILQSVCPEQLYIANNPHPLDIGVMKKCAQQIVGKHSFHHFYSMGSNVKSTEREIYSCELSQIGPHTVFSSSDLFNLPQNLSECYQFRIVGNGFLKQMVRHLMSALWMVGRGKISPEDFSLLLTDQEERGQLWKPAPARGLFLYQINY
jgi:tRNA pseudouridine38-40 synthase